jgi:Ser/Thr protein kinase RdoA (MazF antagonist)
MSEHPYSSLTPDVVLNALEDIGLPCDGRLLALNSYENRVYQVGIDDSSPVVVKFYRSGRWSDAAILEEHAYLLELAEADLPVVAPRLIRGTSLHHFLGQRFAVFPRQGGYAPEFDHPETRVRMGRLIARLHAVGAVRSYEHRPMLDVESFGAAALNDLESCAIVPRDAMSAYRDVALRALDGARSCYDRAGPLLTIRLHGDCYAGNVLWTDEGPHFVDFDDSRSGPAIQDLWMLLSGDRPAMERQLGDLLAGYRAFFDFDSRELHLTEALRTLRLIHYADWLARRWDDPAFPVAFPWFNSERYWAERIAELQQQLERMAEPPLRLGPGAGWPHYH